jgi:hypothetical protein
MPSVVSAFCDLDEVSRGADDAARSGCGSRALFRLFGKSEQAFGITRFHCLKECSTFVMRIRPEATRTDVALVFPKVARPSGGTLKEEE